MFVMSASAQELKIIVPSNVDGYAINARIFGRHLARHLPEKPNVVIQEVPGAFSVVAANYIYNIAPRDGNTIGTFYKNIPLMGALGGYSTKFDSRKFTWLGSTADGREDTVILWSNKTNSIDHYKLENLIVGSETVLSGDPAFLIRDLLGIKVRVVQGYSNSAITRLALEKKEIDAAVYSLIGIRTGKPDWLQPNSGIMPILQFGNGSNRHRDYLEVPTLGELTDQKELLSVYETQFILLRPFVAPPNIPPKRAEELRNAFTKAATDPVFIAEAKKANIDAKLIGWQEAEQIVNQTIDANPSILNRIRNMK